MLSENEKLRTFGDVYGCLSYGARRAIFNAAKEIVGKLKDLRKVRSVSILRNGMRNAAKEFDWIIYV